VGRNVIINPINNFSGVRTILNSIFPQDILQSGVNDNEIDWSLVLNNLLSLYLFLQLPRNLEYEISRVLAEIIAYCLLLTVIKLCHAHDAHQFDIISPYVKDICIYLAKALSDVQHILDEILGVLFYALDPTRKLNDHFSKDSAFFEEFKSNLYDLLKVNELMGKQRVYYISSRTGEEIRYIQDAESKKSIDGNFILEISIMGRSDLKKVQQKEEKDEEEEAWEEENEEWEEEGEEEGEEGDEDEDGEEEEEKAEEVMECKTSSSTLKRKRNEPRDGRETAEEDQKIVEIVCEFYDKTFRRINGLTSHIKYVCKHVSGEEVLKKGITNACEYCKKTFGSSSGLQVHIRDACKNVSEEALQRRIRYDCEYCKKTFNRLTDLKRHVKETCKNISEGALQRRITFDCEYCKITFGNSSALQTHIRDACKNVSEEVLQKRITYDCEYCKKPYGRLNDLKRHIKEACKNVSEEALLKKRTFNCENFDKSFCRPQNLRVHFKNVCKNVSEEELQRRTK
jgi:hypothetical protein